MSGDNPQVPSLVSETYIPDQLIAGRFPIVTGQSITVAESALLARGTVMGQVTATGKYIKSVKTAVDGSQNPVGILADQADASAADVDNVALYLTGEFNGNSLIFDASWSLATLKPALRPEGIFIRDVVSAAPPT